ncbi:Uncharacterised protein [Legionella lansingensis]|uniref:Uncharacterized protein n=1 Tax=Legionella lansingensis TaxID=45067 RepID=A0A0W0VUP2_9GAMM|nr:hypothetical protein [Legionella lansingensis]KTD23752.1 hypothetical protein Llan_0533 [Legionella lansingensis]SNV47496.1 Uncharacterised protein [Legionella lansingensis]
MILSSLYVLHVYDYQKREGAQCPIQRLIKEVNPVVLSTCMRHIYVFSEQQVAEKKELLPEIVRTLQTPVLHQKTPHCELLQGNEAYQFLLFWIIAGLNSKKPFADERILADVRKKCRSYESTTSQQKINAWSVNKIVMLALLTDGKHLLNVTKKLDEEQHKVKERQLRSACENCTWAREKGFMPLLSTIDYKVFPEREKMLTHLQEILMLKETKIRQKLESLTKDKTVLSCLFSKKPLKFRLQQDLETIQKMQKILASETLALEATGTSFQV